MIKDLVPTDDPGRFDLFIDTDELATNVGDGGTTGEQTLATGTYNFSEAGGDTPATDLNDYTVTAACLDDQQQSVTITPSGGGWDVDVGEDDDIVCTITNTAKGMVEVNKTESGTTPPGGTFYTFQLRTGASDVAEGTLIDSCTTNAGGFCNFSGAKFLPGDYQFCEFGVLPGWSSSISLLPGAFILPIGGDNSTYCVDFTLDPGETETFNIDNTPPPGVDPRTIGFWRNWSSCTGGNQDDVLDQTLASAGTISLGALDLIGTSCEDAVNILSKRDTDGKNRANDAAYGMAAQLLAALLNQQAGATICAAANDAIADAEDLLNNALAGATLPTPSFDGMKGHHRQPKGKGKAAVKVGDPSTALSLASTLDGYNNGLLCP